MRRKRNDGCQQQRHMDWATGMPATRKKERHGALTPQKLMPDIIFFRFFEIRP